MFFAFSPVSAVKDPKKDVTGLRSGKQMRTGHRIVKRVRQISLGDQEYPAGARPWNEAEASRRLG